ncbi:hypothetical protein ILUMI_13676 [Ignelater luminosus]|uniref:O-acyltransferase WSD1 C-terminal domain-containing protein n=1 Tax=Ignelater luminosus TaxID=2038154 RepID=A0A8K0GBQ3_IGNLU|nr:hypothetical protein ILUMI_13676 [Ignelater luminosus]
MKMVLILDIIAVLITLINFLEVKRTATGEQPPLWIIPVLLIITICIPIAITVLCTFALYRECVRIILKIKYGERFGGLLNGSDAFHTTGETMQHLIHSLLVYQCPKTMSIQEFYKILETNLRKIYSLPKFNVILKKEFGYSYMLKETSNFDTAFRKMKLINTEDHKLSKVELMLLVDEYANSPLPKDNLIPWEVLVGSQSIKWRDEEHNYYFSFDSYHHALADGVALLKLVVAAHAGNEQNTTARVSRKNFNVTIKFLKLSLEKVLALILIPSWYVSSLILKGRDQNILKRKKLSNQFHFVTNVEDSGYVQKIKRIKNKIAGVSFSDVLLTAVSASFNEFFNKNSAFIREISVILPVLAGSTELLCTKRIEPKDIKVQNNYSTLSLDLPICISKPPDKIDIINRLNLISRKTKALGTSFNYSIHKLITETVWACLPQTLLAYVPKLTSYTAILSLLPGIPKVALDCSNGSVMISDIIAWDPHEFSIESAILINTYDNRLHIAMSIDKTLVQKYDDVQKIADNILKYLDSLEDEVSQFCAL